MNWMRRAAIAAVGLSALVASPFAAAQEAAPQGAAPAANPPQQQQPAWQITCSGASRTSTADCVMEQRVFVTQTGQLFGGMTIRVPAETRAPVMMLQLPLGLFLPAGISLAVDNGAAETMPVQTCEASGCYAGSALSATLLAAMKKGTQLQVTFQNVQKQAITMPISLNGFTAAFASIE